MSSQDQPSPFVLAVLCQKGGVGKTTLATNLAAAAHLGGLRTLVLDCDVQGSAFDWYNAREDGSALAGLAVARADRALRLPKFRELSAGYQAVFIDGPPRLGDITKAAAVAADVVAIPARPGAFDAWALAGTLELLDSADEVRDQLGRGPVRRVIVINGAPSRGRTVAFAQNALGGAAELAEVVIGNRVAFALAAASGESVLTTAPSSAAADEIRALWAALWSPAVAPQEAVPHVH